MKKIIACTLAVLATIIVFGQSGSDSVKVYFNISQWQFEPALGDNAASMDAFIENVRVAAEAQNLDHIVIRGYASPDGPERFNQRLSVERCDAIAALIVERAAISRDLIKTMPVGVSWSELRRLVAETPDVPSREKILDIIDNTPVWIFDAQGRIIDGRKKQLMDLRGGRPYNWMLEHIFPKLRNGVAVSLKLLEQSELSEQSEPSEYSENLEASEHLEHSELSEPSEYSENLEASEHLEHSELSETTDTIAADTITVEPVIDTIAPRYHLALKTNMLYYAALLPNVELEWLINDHWSVAAGVNFAAWGRYEDLKSYRITLLDAEGRYWIKPREPWHGMYVGVLAGGGWYDLENGSPGHYGWGAMSGLTFGYMWSISRRLSLEAEIGAGYMYTRYKDYEPIEGHHVYLRTKELNYFGPIKAKLSIAWRFFEDKKPKRTAPSL